MSDTRLHRRQAGQGLVRLRFLPSIFRLLAIALLVMALARPQSGTHTREITSEGVDIVLVIDRSGSMDSDVWRCVSPQSGRVGYARPAYGE